MASASIRAINPCLNPENKHKYPSFAECVTSFKAFKKKDDAPSSAVIKILDEAKQREKLVRKARKKKIEQIRKQRELEQSEAKEPKIKTMSKERKEQKRQIKEQIAKRKRDERAKILDFILSRKTRSEKQIFKGAR